MSQSAQREPGWQEALSARTKSLLVSSANKHNLSYVFDSEVPVDVCCVYPKQVGLDFEIRFFLQDDEFICGGDGWSAIIFPADNESKWELIERAVDDLITGRARIALYTPLWRTKPFWTELQLYDQDRWQSISTGAGCAFPPIFRPVYLQNNAIPQHGDLGVSFGTLIFILLILAAVYLLL